MNKDDQIRHVYKLLGDVEERIAERIRNGTLPENWDGAELSWYTLELLKEVCPNEQVLEERRASFENDILLIGG